MSLNQHYNDAFWAVLGSLIVSIATITSGAFGLARNRSNIGTIIVKEFLSTGSFLGRGGFTELYLTLALLWYGLVFTISPVDIWETPALRDFFDEGVNHNFIAAPFWAAFAPGALGIALGWIGKAYELSRYLRFVAIIFQVAIWTWLTAATGLTSTGGDALPFYFLNIIASFRVMLLIIIVDSFGPTIKSTAKRVPDFDGDA